MEPRPHERGKKPIAAASTRGEAASMEPRPHERGKTEHSRAARQVKQASMEPRPHERGKTDFSQLVNSAFSLQWSHVLTNVERAFV